MTRLCLQCGKRVGDDGNHLYNTPAGEEVWLCGRQTCEDSYNDGMPPKGKR